MAAPSDGNEATYSPESLDSADTDSNSCHLLKLPPELRNRIYELAFIADTCDKIDLLNANTPSNALLITCREIYSEARSMYKYAYRSLWTLSAFFADVREGTLARVSIATAKLNEIDMEHITRLDLSLIHI